jgi:hypothetical protein
MDPERLELAATSLAVKRARSVARAWPGLAAALGPEFEARFAEFAVGTLIPSRGGPLADGFAFAGWLDSQGLLPAAGRLEQLAVSLRFRTCPEGLEPRRGPALTWAWIDPPGQLVVAACWSPSRVFWVRLPLPWHGRRVARRAGASG